MVSSSSLRAVIAVILRKSGGLRTEGRFWSLLNNSNTIRGRPYVSTGIPSKSTFLYKKAALYACRVSWFGAIDDPTRFSFNFALSLECFHSVFCACSHPFKLHVSLTCSCRKIDIIRGHGVESGRPAALEHREIGIRYRPGLIGLNPQICSDVSTSLHSSSKDL